jgi:hypothetical protein
VHSPSEVNKTQGMEGMVCGKGNQSYNNEHKDAEPQRSTDYIIFWVGLRYTFDTG